jgi:hypothetical protein
MNSKYLLYLIDYKDKTKIDIIWEGDTLSVTVIAVIDEMVKRIDGNSELRVVERHSTGFFITRLIVIIDGRKVCESNDDWGPDKYGF